MSLFTLSTGEVANSNTFESAGGYIKPIPKDTDVLSIIDEVKWDEYNGERYISARWAIMQPQEYSKRKIFQKIKPFQADHEKADKAKRMLAAIDLNAGGKLSALGREPNDQDLMLALCNKPMVLKLGVWVIDKDAQGNPIPKEEQKPGNWVQKVSPRNGVQTPVQPVQGAAVPPALDDIPF